MAETITLSGVPETMLQTVYARAKESRGRGAIRDLKAEEIIGRLDYDFSLADKDAAMHSGVIARTIVLDRLVGEYLAAHPDATVMNLACGLDTRCYRMQGYAHWYNLDLPETIAVREALLPESGSISQLAMSAMDDWGAAVEGPSGPALVIIEGLTMYLTQAAVLNAAFDARLQALRADNAAAGKEKQFHLEKQILPGIAAYERDAAERHAEGRSSADGPRLRGAARLEAPEALPCPDARPRPAPENAGDLHEADPADVR